MTNALESLNSVIRKAVKKRKLFPSDDSARKVVYLAIMDAPKKWTMPIRNWKGALNRFIIEFFTQKYLQSRPLCGNRLATTCISPVLVYP